MARKVLFVTYGGGHAAIIKKIIDAYEGDFDVLALTSGEDSFSDCLTVEDVFQSLPSYDKDIVKALMPLVTRFVEELPNQNRSTVLYYALGAWEAGLDQDSIEELITLSRHNFLQLRSMVYFLRKLDVCCIVTTTSPRFERASILAAKELGLNSYQIDDLFLNVETQFLAKNVFVYSKNEAELLKSSATFRGRAIALGNPNFDIDNVERVETKLIYWCPHREVSYSEDGSVSGRGNDAENVRKEIEAISSLLDKHEDYSCVIRPHPNDGLFGLDSVRLHPRMEVRLAKNEDLGIALSKAALWITPHSTTAIQASMNGIPVITYAFNTNYSLPNTVFKRLSYRQFNSIEELHSGLQDLILPISNIKVNPTYSLSFSKGSAKNIANYIKKNL